MEPLTRPNGMPEVKPRDSGLLLIHTRDVALAVFEVVLSLKALKVAAPYFAGDKPLFCCLAVVCLSLAYFFLYRRFRFNVLRLVIGSDDLRVVRRDRILRLIPYLQVRHLSGTPKEYALAMTVQSAEHPETVSFSRLYYIPYMEDGLRSIARRMGTNALSAMPDAHARRDNEIEKILRAWHNAPPVIPMLSNVTYRYKHKSDLSTLVKSTKFITAYIIVGLILAMIIAPKLSILGDSTLLIIAMSVLFGGFLGALSPTGQFIQSLSHRFVLEDAGTLLVLHKRGWKRLRSPELALGWKGQLLVADAPVIRFGSGLRAYYFDPRFLEEDV